MQRWIIPQKNTLVNTRLRYYTIFLSRAANARSLFPVTIYFSRKLFLLIILFLVLYLGIYNFQSLFDMSLEQELAGLKPKSETALTIGVFDGVHLGHRRLLGVLNDKAESNDFVSGVITFRQHPLSLLKPEAIPPFITNLPQKIKLLKDEGVDFIITLPFTFELAQTGARHFLSLLKKNLKMSELVLGQDFTLGRNQEGDADLLADISRDMHFELTIVPHLKIDSEIVSSTAIRKALADGDIIKVNKMLGRHFSLEGRIISGGGKGTEIGFPTANIDVEPLRAIPADGVYACRIFLDGCKYNSVTNIGKCPTFGKDERTIEIHIMDFEGDLYRRELKVDIIDRLRSEKCFSNSEELKKQIARDIKQALAILENTDK